MLRLVGKVRGARRSGVTRALILFQLRHDPALLRYQHTTRSTTPRQTFFPALVEGGRVGLRGRDTLSRASGHGQSPSLRGY